MRPKTPLVAIFLNPHGIEAVKLIPSKPFTDVEPMIIYAKVSDLVDQMNTRLKDRKGVKSGDE
jgi:hypothetical protein